MTDEKKRPQRVNYVSDSMFDRDLVSWQYEHIERLQRQVERLQAAFRQARADIAVGTGIFHNAASFGLEPEDIGVDREVAVASVDPEPTQPLPIQVTTENCFPCLRDPSGICREHAELIR